MKFQGEVSKQMTTVEQQQQQQQHLSLWRDGKNGNIQFLRSWARLQNEEPNTFKLITKQEEGAQYEDNNYYYKVGRSSYGLWLSRKPKATSAALASTPDSYYVEDSDKSLGKTDQTGQMLVVASQLSRVANDLEQLIELLKKSSLLVSNKEGGS
jgi:hypothetical protein